MKALGSSNLLLAVNTYYGSTEDLPFDLRHKGISLVYSLAEDATKDEIDAVRVKLASTLVLALRHYINAPSTMGAQKEIVKQPAKNPPAFFSVTGKRLRELASQERTKFSSRCKQGERCTYDWSQHAEELPL